MKLKFLLLGLLFSFGCTHPKSVINNTQPPESSPVISTVGELLSFDKKEFTVKASQEITLTFKNQASSMKHNWVLTLPDKSDQVGMDGIKAGEGKDYVPDSPNVIAHSKLIGKGEETIKFKAPVVGNYPYICTFPGHYTVMNGIMHSIP